MQTFINTEHVTSRKRMQRRTMLAWFTLLVVAFTMTFVVRQLVYIAWPLLILAFFVSNISRQIQFESGLPVPTEERLVKALKPLTNRYWFGSYVPIGRQVVDHMLIGPEGLLVIEPRNHPGDTSCAKGRWIRKSGFLPRILGAEPGIGNPTRDVTGLVDLVKQDLEEAGIADVPVNGAVVFTAPNAVLTLDACDVTTLTIHQLQAWASRHRAPAGEMIPESRRHQLVERYSSRPQVEQPIKPAA